MPLPLENQPLVPNAPMVPSITLMTSVTEAGGLKTSANVVLRSAHVSAEGVWTPIGENQSITVCDVENLPEDLASLQSQINEIMFGIVTLIGGLNAIRKVV